jgi:hypothetical protein
LWFLKLLLSRRFISVWWCLKIIFLISLFLDRQWNRIVLYQYFTTFYAVILSCRNQNKFSDQEVKKYLLVGNYTTIFFFNACLFFKVLFRKLLSMAEGISITGTCTIMLIHKMKNSFHLNLRSKDCKFRISSL